MQDGFSYSSGPARHISPWNLGRRRGHLIPHSLFDNSEHFEAWRSHLGLSEWSIPPVGCSHALADRRLKTTYQLLALTSFSGKFGISCNVPILGRINGLVFAPSNAEGVMSLESLKGVYDKCFSIQIIEFWWRIPIKLWTAPGGLQLMRLKGVWISKMFQVKNSLFIYIKQLLCYIYVKLFDL